MDKRDAKTVLAQLPAAFEHFDEIHPHSSLKMRYQGRSDSTRSSYSAALNLKVGAKPR